MATRRTILRAAAEVFASRGYAGASLTDLIAAAGVTKGALYFHFASKEDLARAIFAEDIRFSASSASLRDHPLQQLIDLSHSFATCLQEDPIAQASVRLAIELSFDHVTPPSGFDTWSQSVARLLTEAQQRGDLAPSVEPADAAAVIIASFTGLQLVSEASCQREDLHERLTEWWKLLLAGLAAPHLQGVLQPRGSGAGDRAQQASTAEPEARNVS